MNPLHELSAAGQSPWLDSVRRTLITSGELQRLIDDGITGVTSNPSIFGKAIGGSTDYDEEVARIASDGGDLDPLEVFETLAIVDIQMAADVLRPALRRHRRAGRVRELRGRAAAGARHRRDDRGRPAPLGTDRPPERDDQGPGHPRGPSGDRAVDRRRHQRERHAPVRRRGVRRGGGRVPARHRAPRRGRRTRRPDRLRGLVLRLPRRLGHRRDAARGLARCAAGGDREREGRVRAFRELFSGERWERLAAAGARVQRPLWASTSTKNPAYRDTLYVRRARGPRTP